MHRKDRRPEHLGWVQIALQAAHTDLPHLRISGQSHYGPPDRIAYIDVYGVEDDSARRRQIRDQAGELLQRLGYTVVLEPGRDVYDVSPLRPISAHERMQMFERMRAALGTKG